MTSFTSDQWVIIALIFVLGLLVGGFLFSGGGRKWKSRYKAEVDRRVELERTHAAREKEWRHQDSLRAKSAKDSDILVDNRHDTRSTIADPRHGDRDHDGVPDSRDPVDDRRR